MNNKTAAETLLARAIGEEGADMGTLQIFDPAKNELRIIAAHGFKEEFLDHFKSVKPFDSSFCGRAFGIGSTIVISDVELDRGFRPHLQIARSAGFRSVKSTPVFSESGNKLGVFTLHFSEPKWSWDFSNSEAVQEEFVKLLIQFSRNF